MRLHDKSRKEFETNEALYYSIALSVDAKKMPQFKKELAELLDKYTQEIEDPEGTRIAHLLCGFHLP